METTVFNSTQMHLLNMFSHIHSDQGLNRLKSQLEKFYAQMIDDEMDRLWESGEWDDQKLKDLRDCHFRTPYDR
jgi:hypothetical protein